MHSQAGTCAHNPRLQDTLLGRSLWNSVPERVMGPVTDSSLHTFKCRVHVHLVTAPFIDY